MSDKTIEKVYETKKGPVKVRRTGGWKNAVVVFRPVNPEGNVRELAIAAMIQEPRLLRAAHHRLLNYDGSDQ